jgi:hypothetical protein
MRALTNFEAKAYYKSEAGPKSVAGKDARIRGRRSGSGDRRRPFPGSGTYGIPRQKAKEIRGIRISRKLKQKIVLIAGAKLTVEGGTNA